MIDLIITVLSLIVSLFSVVYLRFTAGAVLIEGIVIFVLMYIVTYILLLLLCWLFFSVISLTIDTKKEYSKSSRFYSITFSLLMESALHIVGARVIVKNLDKLPKNEKFLFVSNHRSVYDTFIQVAAFRKYPIAFISKEENFHIPVGHRFMTRCRYMSLDRDDLRSGAIITRKAADMIASGDCSIGVYPEGTRNRTEDTLIEFKHGTFKTALWAKSPIVIGVVRNSDRIKKLPVILHKKVEFEIIDVLEYEQIKDMRTVEIAELVRNKMLEALE